MNKTFKISYQTYWGQNLMILGSTPELGEWDRAKAIAMNYVEGGVWEIAINLKQRNSTILYQYIVAEANKPDICEKGFPHQLNIENGNSIQLDTWNNNDNNRQFRNKPSDWRGAGVAIPLFSLKSEDSFGIGEYSDIQLMVDWAADTHQQFIQLLPINDTTMTHTYLDSYPYHAISIFALHPLYINLRKMGILQDEEKLHKFIKTGKRLNSLEEVNYEEVDKYKWEYFALLYKQERDALKFNPQYNSFVEENKNWLLPYAKFSYLRDKFLTCDYHHWSKYANYHSHEVHELTKQEKRADKINFYCFLQFHAHLQMKAAHDYASSKGVMLKGDIPIGISRHSVEAWIEPEFFNLKYQTGAPPDDFSQTGQNWGFPTYKWEQMEKDGYTWWKKRFTNMAQYFDAYRIDHILGFFRIWQIPRHSVQGMIGHFSPSIPFSVRELEDRGIECNHRLMLKPYIDAHRITSLFGANAKNAKLQFFEHNEDHHTFSLSEKFDTQAKVKEHCNEIGDHKAIESLYEIINDVMLIEDEEVCCHFHPRINLMDSYTFSKLPLSQQQTLRNLHNEYYYQRNNQFWKIQALKKLPPLIMATDMLSCGEDLGMIPATVPEVMQTLQLLTLEIERMPKAMHTEFGDVYHYPYRSVCTTSTHDMTGIRGWWKENRILTQRYFNNVLSLKGTAPEELSGSLSKKIIERHLFSPAMLTILPLQDWMAMDESIRREDYDEERINIPANPQHYWKYRMHLTIEKLLKSKTFNDLIRRVIIDSNR